MQQVWRLHPPPHTSQSHPSLTNIRKSELDHAQRAVSNTKFNFKLGDDVYFRPKSSKELGLAGRIVDIYDAASSRAIASEKSPTGGSKKRRLAEDVRVSIKPHCFDGNMEKKAHVKQNVRPSRLFPVHDIRNDHETVPHGSLIIITPDTTNFRQLVSRQLERIYKFDPLKIGHD